MRTSKAMLFLVAALTLWGLAQAQSPSKQSVSLSTDPGNATRVLRYWTGAMSPWWNVPNNWSPPGVPTNVDDVVISAPGALNMPIVNIPYAVCRTLRVEMGRMLTVTAPGFLHVYGQVESFGNIDMSYQMTVDGQLLLHAGSLFNSPTPTSMLRVDGDCRFESGSQIVMNQGQLLLSSSLAGMINMMVNQTSVCSFFDVFLNKTGGTMRLDSASTLPITIDGSLTVANTSTLVMDMTPALFLGEDIIVQSGGHIYGLQGEVCCQGGGGSIQLVDFGGTDSYFRHLRINSTVELLSDIRIDGDLHLDGGSFHPLSHTVRLKGDWCDNVGPAGFLKGTSRVVFCGSGGQTILSPLSSTMPVVEFHIVELDKATGLLALDFPGQIVSCDAYDHSCGGISVANATLNVLSLLDSQITGDFELHDPGVINITGTAVGLNGNLAISGGTFNVYGGVSEAQWPAGGNGSVTMGGGVLVYHDVGVTVDWLTLPFLENITGGTIRVNGSFHIQRPDFHPTGGTLEFTGPTLATLSMVPGACLYNVLVNKTSSTTPGILNSGSLLTLNGWLDIRPDSFFDVFEDVDIPYGDLILAGAMKVRAESRVEVGGNLDEEESGSLEIKSPWGDGGYVKYGYGGMNHIFTYIRGEILVEDGATLDTNKHVCVTPTGHIDVLGGGGGAGGGVICNGIEALFAGSFAPSGGYLEIRSVDDGIPVNLILGSGNYAHRLVINSPSPVVLGHACAILGDLHIIQGLLDVSTSNYGISLAGSWTDDPPEGGFEARNGTVTMLGGGNVYINAGSLREEFYNLHIAKTAGGRVLTNCELQLNGSYSDEPESFFDVFFDIDIMQNAVTQGYIVIHGSATVLVFGGYDTTPTHNLTVANNGKLGLQMASGADIEEEGEVIMEQGSLWESNAPLSVTSTGSIVFTTGGGGGSGACIACPGFTALTPGSFVPTMGILEIIPTTLGGWTQSVDIAPGNNAYNLVINSGGYVRLDNDCDVAGDLDIMPESFFDVFFDVFVAGDLDLWGEMEVHPGVLTEIGGDIEFEETGALEIDGGGSSAGYVKYGFGGMNHIITQMRSDIQIQEGVILETNHFLHIQPTGSIVFIAGGGGAGGSIRCRGFEALTPGSFVPACGRLDITGSSADSPQYVNIAPGNNAYDLSISSTGPVSSLNDCDILGDLDIMPDSFFDVFFDISLGGDLHLAGELVLENAVHATVSGLPTLGVGSVLILNMSADIITNDLLATMPPLYAQGLIIISDGEFIANQALVVTSTGSIQFTDGGGGGGSGKIICRGLEALAPGTFDPDMGTLELIGTPTAAYIHINVGIGNKAFNLAVNTPTIAVLDNNLVVAGDLDLNQGVLDASASNYDIYCWGSWATNSTTAGFEPRNASVHFVGSGDCGISTVKDHEEFHDLVINKSGTVTLHDNVSTMGDGVCDVVLGTLYVNNVLLTVSGDCSIASGGMLYLDGGECALGDGRVLTVNGGGTCKAHGNRNRDSKMKGKDESWWKMHVGSGGHVSAKQTEFKQVREEGIKVDAGATVDPDADFDECKFLQGAPGCTYLTIDNSQPLVIDALTLNASGGELHNIAKLENAGHILVNSCTGNFTGPAFENDAHNLVDWIGFDPNLVVTQFYASNYDPYVCDPVTYHARVENQSSVIIINAINLRWINPATGEYEDHWISGMPGWGVVDLDWNDTSSQPGLDVTEVYVDPDDLIVESNEADNFLPIPQPVVWHELPLATEMTIMRLGGDTGRLDWEYPIWVSRYHIYASDDPYGTFSHLGYAVESFFDVYMADPKLFYKVTAERDAPPGE